MTQQIGLYRFKLAQKRYKDGAFYWSAILDGQQARAFDGRFMLEEGAKLTPTKNGFRIPSEKLADLKKALGGDLRDLEDILIVVNKSFQLHLRYLNDKYGEGIDFRKFRTTDKYHGWDKSGIRMQLEDVATLQDWLSDFHPDEIDPSKDLFAGRDLGNRDHDKGDQESVQQETLNPTIKQLLEFSC